jgi:SAM-dependent methyltransferase
MVMSGSYRNSHTSPGYGLSYEREFRDNPYRSLIWQLEKRILDKIVRRLPCAGPLRYLDFACGTGRILAHMENYAQVSIGVDVSPSMLQLARESVKRARLIQADLTRGDVLGSAVFDLITAFRFFPNAEPELRDQVMGALIRHLSPNGCLVFNNHMNLSSLMYRVSRLLGRGGREGMSQNEVDQLIELHGLRITGTYCVGLMPVTEEHMILPRPVLYGIEWLATTCGASARLSQDLIFVCRSKE